MENRTEEPGVLTPPATPKAPQGPSASSSNPTPEEIERQMQETRDSLAEKVVALENQVVGTVQTAANTITDTVERVKSLVDTAPEAVTDTVKQTATTVSNTLKEALDFTGHVKRHPWTAMGISAGLGFLTALVLFREKAAATQTAPHTAAPQHPGPQPAAEQAEPGVLDDLMELVGKKVRGIVETAIDSASAAVTEQVRDGIPKLVETATESNRRPQRNGARQYA